MVRKGNPLVIGNSLSWTRHAKKKRKQYGISKSRVKRTIKYPDRVQTGVASGTIASMKKTRTKRRTEIWVMYKIIKEEKEVIKIISTWKYPGKSPKGDPPPIPEDVLQELINQGLIKK